MIVSKKLLAQWIDISDINDDEIAKALNNLGFEVEKVINLTKINTNIVVGEITSIKKHPKSKHLNLCNVNVGDNHLKIVCGAQNIAIGLKVVVAKIGATLANGMKILHREIQGEASQGMICSLTELGLHKAVQSDAELQGIVHLPDDATVGWNNPLNYLSLNDTIFEIQLTLNRSDCLAMYNIAQELSNYFKIPLIPMEISDLSKLNTVDRQFSINNSLIEALATLKIKLLSPLASHNLGYDISRTLQLANIKPISFFDDLTNLVMLELGQPVLAFNGDILKEPAIYTSPKDYPDSQQSHLKIYNGDITLNDKYLTFNTLGLGTLESYQVKNSCESIYLISINPELNSMQKQIKRHGILADTLLLQRLSKPIVPDYYLLVLQRILFLLAKFQVQYQVISFTNDIKFTSQVKKITFNCQEINQILGTEIPLSEIINLLKLTKSIVEQDSSNHTILYLETPPHRNDLTNVNDYAEEIARFIGYDNLPVIKPELMINPNDISHLNQLLNNFRSYLLHKGFHQVKTYSLTSKNSIKDFNFFSYENPIILSSPLTSAREVMRFSLIESLLEIYRSNLLYKQKNLNFFCDDVIYTGDDNADQHHLAFLISKNLMSYQSINKDSDFYIVKGLIEVFLKQEFGRDFIDQWDYEKLDNNKFHPYLSKKILYDKSHFATIAKLHPQVMQKWNLLDDFYVVELNCSSLELIWQKINKNKSAKFVPWSKFNPLSRDISITISNETSFKEIKTMIIENNISNLVAINFVDIYNDDKLFDEEKKALTFNLQFNSNYEQLSEEKILDSIKDIKKLLVKNFAAQLR